jgi:hypothetical protein
VCMKSSDASARSFTQPAYSISCKGEKNVLIMKKTLWKNNVNLVQDASMIYVNFTIQTDPDLRSSDISRSGLT